MSTILLTGFEAYGNTPINPAELVARKLDGADVMGHRVISRVVPNSFFICIDAVKQAIEETGADTIVMMGEYGGRSMVTVERLAQNLNDATRYGLTDNEGKALQDVLTNPDGPAAYRTNLPIRAMVKAMRDAGIPADISDADGTFCCNHLFYGILDHIAQNRLPLRAGWIHLPFLPEVAALDANLGAPSMSVETAAKGVMVGLQAVMTHPFDSHEAVHSRLQI
ncbi:pyroglutamyl-peptidase I [Roseibium sp. RKSG952]|uniref:pyroglutamyl-peptidase I n=1 Tax=Roseibium sp. RKSG952 TaxID=2529384 RepID=UPI0012BC1B35|nr:pyroglutamyl-peptidase I [Roseibium sp. RKSG952]MTH98147.1 pyroglutamyl-peptidase I [Roseibium sp. RKSG952]